jgi:hypothetical protein
MAGITRRELLGSALVTLGGCAALSVPTPTPARDLPPGMPDDPEPGMRYFLAIFGSQSSPKLLWKTHTFGTAMKATTDPATGTLILVEAHTISWLPQTMHLRPLALHPEPGKNFSLHETIQFAIKDGQHVAQWGPYEIRHRRYERFVIQKAFLDSGVVGYQAIDTLGEAAKKGNACDCVHAITDMDPYFDRAYFPLTRLGYSASRWIVKQFWTTGAIIDTSKTYPELNAQLGLDQFEISHRTYPD